MPAAGTKASRKKVRRPGQFHWRGGDQRWRHRALLRQTDRRLGLTQALAQVLPDPRDPGRITHSLLSLLRVASAVVREGQIGGGYGSWQTKDTKRVYHERNSQRPTSSSSATSWTVGTSANLGPFDCRRPSGQSPRLQPSPTVWGRWRGPCDWTTSMSIPSSNSSPCRSTASKSPRTPPAGCHGITPRRWHLPTPADPRIPFPLAVPQISPPARPISWNFQDSRPSARLPRHTILQLRDAQCDRLGAGIKVKMSVSGIRQKTLASHAG